MNGALCLSKDASPCISSSHYHIIASSHLFSYSVHTVAQALQAQVHGSSSAAVVRWLSIDSRRIGFPEQTLFVALASPQKDGHDFIPDAWEQGVRLFLVSRLPAELLPQSCYLLVPHTLVALQTLAGWHRRQCRAQVLAITGSNGKTIVKDWLYEMLEGSCRVVRSPKSFNSQIGVPLSLWELQPDTEWGIIEAGISRPGEMDKLAAIIEPNSGIFTMLGDAHDEGFASKEEKLIEKLRLFAHCRQLLYCADDERVAKAVATHYAGQAIGWGHSDTATVRIMQQQRQQRHTEVMLQWGPQQVAWHLPFADDASVQNALHAAIWMLVNGWDAGLIAERLRHLQPLDMRLQWKKARHGCYLLNDSYVNDFTSLQQALNNLVLYGHHQQRVAILSDLSVTDEEAPAVYAALPALLRQKQVGQLLAVGPAMAQYAASWQVPDLQVQHFADTQALLQQLPPLAHADVLLKGGRSFAFETIARQLEEQQHQTVLEIHAAALLQNLQHYRQQLQPGVRLMAMVKAFGYGNGDAEVARLLQQHRADYLAVAYVDEGVTLRQAGIHLPIMVLNTDPAAFASMEAHLLEPEVYSFQFLQQLLQWCRHRGIRHYPVHLKVDTGMHRLGFLPHEIAALCSQLQQQEELIVKSVFTHLVASEDAAADAFTQQQLQRFEAVCSQLQQALGYSFLQHAANTAAISRHPQAHYHMVRLGVGLYGGAPGLQPVMKLKTTVAQVKQVPAGETVGYGRSAVLHRDSLIATVRIGYADGYARSLSNGRGYMWLQGHRAPVVGRVCMDMTMLDITDLPVIVQPDDEVEVFGDHIGLHELAAWQGTISYEVMTSISQRVKRVYVYE